MYNNYSQGWIMENTRSEKIKNILEFYLSATYLKDVPRTGWLNWKVKRDRIEYVPDHIFATTQLAFAFWSEFDIPVNIDRVIAMLSFHETEEPVIGDIPLVHDLKKYKKEMGAIAVTSLTENMAKKNYIRGLIAEFEEQKTPEAKFAKFIDKLECDIQSKIYDEEETVDLSDQEDNQSSHVPLVEKLLNEGKSFSKMWMGFGRASYGYPEEFESVSKYAEENNLHEIRDTKIEAAKQKVKAYLKTVEEK